MTKNQQAVIFLTVIFYLAFLAMVGFGIDMTYRSIEMPESFEKETNLKLNTSTEGFEIELTTAIPGIVLIVLGGGGLILMAQKVPTKEIVGYRQERSDSDTMHYHTLTIGPSPVYAKNKTKIPLPVWWIIKQKRVFIEAKEHA